MWVWVLFALPPMTTMTLDIGNWTDGVLVDASVCTWLIRSEVLTSNCRDLHTRAKDARETCI